MSTIHNVDNYVETWSHNSQRPVEKNSDVVQTHISAGNIRGPVRR